MKRTCFFGFLSIILALSFIGSNIYSARQVAIREADADTTGLVRFLAMDIERMFYGVEQMFVGLDNLLISNDKTHLDGINDVLLRLKANNSYLMDLLIVAPSGKIVNWSGPGTPPDITDREYLRYHFNHKNSSFYIGKPQQSKVHNQQWFFGFSKADRDQSGQLQRILVAIIDIEHLYRRYQNLNLPEDMIMTISSEDGTIYTRIPGHEWVVGQNFPDGIKLLCNLKKNKIFHGASPVNGERLFASLERVGDTSMVAAVSVKEDDVFADWRRHSLLMGGFGLAVGGILFTLSILTVRSQQEQFRIQQQLQQQATTDPLTGIANRRYALEQAALEIKRNQRAETPFSVVMMDIDHFKKVNDTYGHHVGDQVLMEVAQTCRNHCRESDLVSRFGGEEFLILLPSTNLNGAQTHAEKIRQAIEALSFPTAEGNISVTASFGVSQWQAETKIDRVVSRADAALYQAKHDGRNCVRLQKNG
ncbi:sensor domain-containing diguanylate cyclase [uncultured Desulfuromonas sp.]|uniref:sensor domain-containing diguanylate cyclase n=1 Tax=uncultured Desulfuromonas sp. TaxID=181013 RepID=UPI002AAB79CB|nr:sensor domain-containing diguanylate cyclase [uncultured Desulfuromonas sp.]